MSDRAGRSLVHLQNSASTSRVLNLHKVWQANQEERVTPPLFQHPLLDRSLIIKHRLRPNEMDIFRNSRTCATKIILPIDCTDLKLGGHSIFVGQSGYLRSMDNAFGAGFERTDDYAVLEAIDQLPSLDPFLLREHLKRSGYKPHQSYFDMSEADIQRMFSFARNEIFKLVSLSFGTLGATDAQVSRLVHKILNDADDQDMEPLRQTLRLERSEYKEGLFCWKGFIYYKWSLSGTLPLIGPVMEEIQHLRPLGAMTNEQATALVDSRISIRRAIQRACAVVTSTLKVYDNAYEKLVHEGRPLVFREFLLDAPRLFTNIGERLGAISHVASYWRYKFPQGVRSRIGYEDLMDILTDFEDCLYFPEAHAPTSRAA